MESEGITLRGVDRLDGDEGFAEVFLDNVFVPDDHIIGEVDKGWYVAMATTSGLSLRSPGRFMATATRLINLYKRYREEASPALRDQVVKLDGCGRLPALHLNGHQNVDGRSIGAESSLNKIFWSEMDVKTHETGLDILAELGELEPEAPDAQDHGGWMKGYQFALAGPIYAGTNEIQRNVVAERVLGLPRK